MRLPFKFKKDEFQKLIIKIHQINSINLDSKLNVENWINYLLNYLELQNILTVENGYGKESDGHLRPSEYLYISFDLCATEKVSFKDFSNAIVIFNNHLKEEKNIIVNKSEIDIYKEKFHKFLSEIPKTYIVKVGLSPKEESIIKAESGFPEYWFFYKSEIDYQYPSAFYKYLLNLNFKNETLLYNMEGSYLPTSGYAYAYATKSK